MIGNEVHSEGLTALSVAAAELVEEHHHELATIMPVDAGTQLARMRRLRKLGMNLAALGEAGIVLVDSSLHSGS
jgi:hypothetical protein